MDTETQQRVREDAARWYARLQAPDCTQFERAQFRRWLAADPKHRAAYDAAEEIAVDLLGAAALDSRLKAMADEAFALGPELWADADDDIDASDAAAAAIDAPQIDALERTDAPRCEPAIAGAPTAGSAVAALPVRRRWFVPAAAAASAAAIALTLALTQLRTGPDADGVFATDDQQREIDLSDGSVVHVDVRTELEVDYTAGERRIVLRHGRAIFKVAHDAERPFRVFSGGNEVEALGTVFEVSQDRDEVVVMLAEGRVEVTGERRGRLHREELSPGQELSIPVGLADWRRREVDPEAATAWSMGRHVFRDVRLADAVDEINRYARTKVRLADPTLADLRVSGSFLAGDSETVVSAFAAVLPLRVSSDGRDVLLFRRIGAYSQATVKDDAASRKQTAEPQRGS